MKRYFLVFFAYTLDSSVKVSGSGQLTAYTDGDYLNSNTIHKAIAKDVCKRNHYDINQIRVQLTNIIELSQTDYADFTKL